MGYLSDEQRQQIDEMFHMADFRTMFDICNNLYSQLGFQDKLTDKERISEYKYITQQFRKYISNRYEPILACGSNLDSMISTVESWISDAPEYGDDRKSIVYNFIRDGWLISVFNGLKYLVDTSNSEEDEDGWAR